MTRSQRRTVGLIFTYVLAFVAIIALVATQVLFFAAAWFFTPAKELERADDPEYFAVLRKEIDAELTDYAAYCDCPADILIGNITDEQITDYQKAEIAAIYEILYDHRPEMPQPIDLTALETAVREDTKAYCEQFGVPFDETMEKGIGEIVKSVRGIVTNTVTIISAEDLTEGTGGAVYEMISGYLPTMQTLIMAALRLPWFLLMLAIVAMLLMIIPLKHHKTRLLYWYGCIVGLATLMLLTVAAVLLIDDPASRLALGMPQVVFAADHLLVGFTTGLFILELVLLVAGTTCSVLYFYLRRRRHGSHSHRHHHDD